MDITGFVRKHGRFLLALYWILGLSLGVAAYCQNYGTSIGQISRLPVSGASMEGVMVTVILPLFISCLLAFFSPTLLLTVCGCKAFLLAYIGMGTIDSFGPTGWLVRSILLLGNCVFVPLLYLFWLRCFSAYSGIGYKVRSSI